MTEDMSTTVIGVFGADIYLLHDFFDMVNYTGTNGTIWA